VAVFSDCPRRDVAVLSARPGLRGFGVCPPVIAAWEVWLYCPPVIGGCGSIVLGSWVLECSTCHSGGCGNIVRLSYGCCCSIVRLSLAQGMGVLPALPRLGGVAVLPACPGLRDVAVLSAYPGLRDV
jgi:hypothetical protein